MFVVGCLSFGLIWTRLETESNLFVSDLGRGGDWKRTGDWNEMKCGRTFSVSWNTKAFHFFGNSFDLQHFNKNVWSAHIEHSFKKIVFPNLWCVGGSHSGNRLISIPQTLCIQVCSSGGLIVGLQEEEEPRCTWEIMHTTPMIIHEITLH